MYSADLVAEYLTYLHNICRTFHLDEECTQVLFYELKLFDVAKFNE